MIARYVYLCLLAMGACLSMPSSSGLAQSVALPVDQAFKFDVVRGEGDTVRLGWTIAPGYYLYKERIAVTSGDAKAVLLSFHGQEITKDDPTFGETVIFRDHLSAIVDGDGIMGFALVIKYQGCQEHGICYPPVTKRIDPSTLPSANADSPFRPTPLGEAAVTKADGITLAQDGGGLVRSLLEDGGAGWVLASFLVFGILLAFTPCVFPMYPILGAAIAGAGDNVKPTRALLLSAVYVFSMSLAFGLLGVAAAWSGRNLQVALQSPYALLGVSGLFIALALSMFGLYELQLPSRWVNSLSRVGGGRSGSLLSTAVLGFSAALIVGPCVTAPLAGALLYIAQTGNVALGALALFTLGVGKGIPLIMFGVIGQRLMPKAGTWMEGVKKAFGLVFVGNAIWLVSRLIPGEYVLALWSVFLIGTGAWLGAFDSLLWDAPASRRWSKAVGVAASLYGVILAVGAASGSADLLRPLDQIGAAKTPAETATVDQFAKATDPASLSSLIAATPGRPNLVYVTADWCVTCTVIDRGIFTDVKVRSRLTRLNLIKIDVTDNTDLQQKMMSTLGVVGPPTMIFVDGAAREIAGSRLVGDISSEMLLTSIAKAEQEK